MKNIGIVVLLLLMTAPVIAAEKPLAPGVAEALTHALQAELQAAASYEAFATKADQEGYRGAGSLFRACAKAERIHASRFKAALKKYGAEIPTEAAPLVETRATAENLQSAIAAEQHERDVTYRESLDAAKAEKRADIARLFDVTRDTETEHANLLAAANRNLDDMKKPHTYFVCDQCGYTSDVKLGLCPSCRADHDLKAVN